MRIFKLLCGAWILTLVASPAGAASLNELDRLAIEALEQRVVPLPGPARDTRDTQTASLSTRMSQTRVPAVSVALFENGKIKWKRAYGEAVAGTGRRIDQATRFQAASMSKAVAAAGALRLVEQRRLRLDEDVSLRLKGWRNPAAPTATTAKITLRRLLSHSAGLNVAGYPGYPADRTAPTIVQSLAGTAPAETAPVRPFATPGERLAYSGGGYSVAQLLMTEAAGADFAALMERAVLRPAGMRDSSFAQSPTLHPEAASGHDPDGRPIPGGGHIYPEMAAAGLWSTASDYARFVIALQDSWAGRRNALLRRATARAMMTPVLGDYGLGVTIVERGGRTFFTHGGANEGFRSRFVAFLDGPRQGLVVMTNGENGGALAAAIQRTIAEAYGWGDLSAPPTPRAPDE